MQRILCLSCWRVLLRMTGPIKRAGKARVSSIALLYFYLVYCVYILVFLVYIYMLTFMFTVCIRYTVHCFIAHMLYHIGKHGQSKRSSTNQPSLLATTEVQPATGDDSSDDDARVVAGGRKREKGLRARGTVSIHLHAYHTYYRDIILYIIRISVRILCY